MSDAERQENQRLPSFVEKKKNILKLPLDFFLKRSIIIFVGREADAKNLKNMHL